MTVALIYNLNTIAFLETYIILFYYFMNWTPILFSNSSKLFNESDTTITQKQVLLHLESTSQSLI